MLQTNISDNNSQSHQSLHKPDSPYSSGNYDNEEFYPETEEEINITTTARERPCPRPYLQSLPENQDLYEELRHKPEVDERRKLEKTIFHKAMIGIGPYLVEKAASVLEASRSVSGDLSYLPNRILETGRKAIQNPNYSSNGFKVGPPPRSRSLTKGFQKLRIGSGQNSRKGTNFSRGSNMIRFQKGHHPPRKANNKSSSTSSIGRKIIPTKYYDSTVNQRLHSARKGMIKELKSRITDLESQLKESHKENQVLQRLQHRHEVALSKYEGAEAELPKLIRSHLAEVKSLTESLRKAQNQSRNIDEKIKSRDQKIFRLEEENKALVTLVKQNDLDDKSKLSELLVQVRNELHVSEARVEELQRHIEILEKNHRHQISVEKKKLRTTNNKLFEAHQELDKLYINLKEKERMITCLRIRQGQSQIPCGAGGTRPLAAFQDEASIRSSRTLPAKKSQNHCDTGDHTFKESGVRRQRSENLNRPNQKRYPAHSKTFPPYPMTPRLTNSHKDSRELIRQPKGKEPINVNTRYHARHQASRATPVSPPSGRAEKVTISPRTITPNLETASDTEDDSSVSQVVLDSIQLQGAQTGTDRSHSSGAKKEEAVNDDEYYNFENVMVEDDNYHPHKSLFMDAMDSSCNVSSGHSPLDSMRGSILNKNLRPSSAGPKFRLSKKYAEHSYNGQVTGSSTKCSPKSDVNATVQDHSKNLFIVFRNKGNSLDPDMGGGDAPTVNTVKARIMSVQDDCFISQRSLASANIDCKPTSATTATEGSDEDTSCDSSALCSAGKSPSENESRPAYHQHNEAGVIESVFSKWNSRKISVLNSSCERAPAETSPRGDEQLPKTLTDMQTRKTLEDIVTLTNAAYFPLHSNNAAFSERNVGEHILKQEQRFKTACQPFFNPTSSRSPMASPEPESNSACELKSTVPWLVGKESGEVVKDDSTHGSCKEKIGIKGQHSSILEPRHSLPLSTGTMCKKQICKARSAIDDGFGVLRKKFTIGSISAVTATNIPNTAPKKLTSVTGKGKCSPSAPGWK